MLLTQTTAILVALLPAAMAANTYDVWYHTRAGCSGSRSERLGCPGIPAYECCDAPPGASNFKYAVVRGSGDVAIVGFHYPTLHGQCAALVSTGSLGICYNNDPFRPIAVYPLADVQRAKSHGDPDLKVLGSISFGDFSPIFGLSKRENGTDELNKDSTPPQGKCHKPNSLLLSSGGMFKVEEENLTAQFTRDIEDPDISDDELVEKYGLEVHPEADDPRWWSYDPAGSGKKIPVIRANDTESTEGFLKLSKPGVQA